VLLIAVSVCAFLTAGRVDAAGQAPRTDAEGLTADALRSGGYVIFFRHALADDGNDATPVDLDDCRTQRNLSGQGLRDARAIGQGFRSLGIPVGQVLTSEYCRVRETALVAFGRAENAPWLNFCCNDDRPFSDTERVDLLRQALATVPEPGMNTVIVGHLGPLHADLDSGEAAIYLPDGSGGYTRIARVRVHDWMDGVYPRN
jgi:phosphohistidine phosphatase SixA